MLDAIWINTEETMPYKRIPTQKNPHRVIPTFIKLLENPHS